MSGISFSDEEQVYLNHLRDENFDLSHYEDLLRYWKIGAYTHLSQETKDIRLKVLPFYIAERKTLALIGAKND